MVADRRPAPRPLVQLALACNCLAALELEPLVDGLVCVEPLGMGMSMPIAVHRGALASRGKLLG